MWWALLVFLGVVLAVHWFEYKHSVQEYTFAQPMAIDQHAELRQVLSEKTPVVVEIGLLPWRPELAEKSAWSILTDQGLISSSEWMKQKQPMYNGDSISEQIELTNGLNDLDEARAWWWIPGLLLPTVDIIHPGKPVGLSWITAERQWIGCSSGGPMTLWLVHSRYRRFLPSGPNVDPWSLTSVEAPWIGRVQYIEVIVKAGWCIGLPAHWGWAARSGETESWYWTASQHSTMSMAMSNQWHIEVLPTESEL